MENKDVGNNMMQCILVFNGYSWADLLPKIKVILVRRQTLQYITNNVLTRLESDFFIICR